VPEYELEAEQATRDWLVMADAEDAPSTWAAAASLFRQAIPLDQWARSLSAARTPLGAVVSRTLRDARVATELPGAPDGEYVVFQFDTQFERKRTAVETITPMRDTDGRWRVSGYFIR